MSPVNVRGAHTYVRKYTEGTYVYMNAHYQFLGLIIIFQRTLRQIKNENVIEPRLPALEETDHRLAGCQVSFTFERPKSHTYVRTQTWAHFKGYQK